MKDVYADVFASLILVGTVLLSMPAWSMDEMTDGQLASTTGQDGLTVLVTLPVVSSVTSIPFGQGTGVSGTPGNSSGNIVYTDTNGIPTSTLAGYGCTAPCSTNSGSLRTDLNAIQFYGAGMATGSYLLKTVLDTSGGSTGVNPVMAGTITMPNVRTISTVFNTNASGAGDLLGLVPLGANAAGVLAVNNASITPILSVGTYTYGGTAATPTATVSTTPQVFNINLGSDVNIGLQLGAPTSGAMITFTSLNISSIDFNGQALNLESPNAGTTNCSTTTICASRLSVTPSITGLNLSGATLGVATAANLNTALGLPAGTLTAGGLLFQDSSITGVGMTFNNLTAGTPGNISGTSNTTGFSGSANTLFASGMQNAPLGSFGVTNMAVSNLKIAVSGM